MIRVAQAASSETFSKYGTSPNQRRTGVTSSKPEGNLDGELNVIAFKGGWECVYRPLDESVAEYIASFMLSAVSNGSHIGYSQDETRTGVFDECKKMTIPNPAKITALVNTDCSAIVGAAIYFAGIKLDSLRKLCTWQMDDVLLGSGAFSKISTKELCQQGKGIRRGDVLWKTGHCAVSLDTDESYPRLSLTDKGLFFGDEKGNLTGQYPNNVNMKGLFVFQKYTFSASITSGTSGTRATQQTKSISKSGYRPIVARLASVSDSSLCNVVPFLGGGEDKKLYVNYYRASGGSGTINTTVIVVFVRTSVTS